MVSVDGAEVARIGPGPRVLLGVAASPNMIRGRCDFSNPLMIDDGDEGVMRDPAGRPQGSVWATVSPGVVVMWYWFTLSS